MNIHKTAEQLFNELEQLKVTYKEVLKKSKLATEYTTKFPSTFIESIDNLPKSLKPTIDNLKNQARTVLKKEYEAKKELDTKLEEITMKVNIITDQVKLLEYMSSSKIENRN